MNKPVTSIKIMYFLFSMLLLTVTCAPAHAFHPIEPDQEKIQEYISGHFPKLQQISKERLETMMNNCSGEQPILIDARSSEEYTVSHLKGAVNIESGKKAFDFLRNQDRNRPIVVYCSVGIRSSALANRLRAAGYANIYSLKGGLFKWANEGRPLVSGGKQVFKVHRYDDTWGTLLRRDYWAAESD